MPLHTSDTIHISQRAHWSTAVSSCKTALALLSHYEKEDYALVNVALHSLRQLVGLGSNFEDMKKVLQPPPPATKKKKEREIKEIDLYTTQKWDIINHSEIHIPVGVNEFITAKVIDTVERLDAIIPVLTKAKKIAVDCEFLGEKHKSPEVKCIQVAPSDRIGYNILIDRIGADVIREKLSRVLSSPNINRIGWAFNADGTAMEKLFDMTIGSTLDLQAKMKDTEGETMNLGSAVQKYAKSWKGYHRFLEAKSLSASFHFTGKECVWIQYPLPPAALVYSIFDVVSLHALDDATSINLTRDSHFWPWCAMPGPRSRNNKTSKGTSSKAVLKDKLEEFEFDPEDEDFIKLPRKKPLLSQHEDEKFLDDLNLAVQLSLQEAEKPKTSEDNLTEPQPKVGGSDVETKSEVSRKGQKSISKAESLTRYSKSGGKPKLKHDDSELVETNEEDDERGTVTHYNLSSSTTNTTMKGKENMLLATESKKNAFSADMQGLSEEEEIEMWKGFALQQWKNGVDVSLDQRGRGSQWQSPALRSSQKDVKLSLSSDSRSSNNTGSPRPSKREKYQNDTKKKNKRQTNPSVVRDETLSSDESVGRDTPPKIRTPHINMHPIIIQKKQAVSEDNFESDMPLDDNTLLHLHTINSLQRLKAMKFGNANKALTSSVVILGHFQQTSSKHKKLHAIQLLTETDDVYTILLNSAVPNPNDVQGSLLEFILTASTVRRVSWEFEELAKHIQARLMITPGRTLCLKPRIEKMNPDVTLQIAMDHLLPSWPQANLYTELRNEKAALKTSKFIDYWAKDLPPYQVIKAGVIECRAIKDISLTDLFSSNNVSDSDYWDAMPK
ncbi:hypothetical protein BGW37DRAFT_274673 [Umbelopsis sp. PMI_123]|nr:hypothetical protein BGW37DRAFT_274673 [Umbelopsis sp. PMI_123]